MMIDGSLPRRPGYLRAIMLAGCVAVMAAASIGPSALAQSAPGRSEPGELRPVNPDDIMGLTDINDAEISPDGRHILYETPPTPANPRPVRTDIWLVASDGKSQATRLTTGPTPAHLKSMGEG